MRCRESGHRVLVAILVARGPGRGACGVSRVMRTDFMTVHTDITPADWTAFVRFVTRSVSKSSGGRLGSWLVALGVGATVGVTVALTDVGLHLPSLLIGAVVGTLSLVVVSRLQVRGMIPAPDGFILGQRQVTLSDDGLRDTSQRHESFFQWRGVRGAEVTDQHVFVMVDNIAAVIVPRRAFSKDSEREQFVGEIQRRAGGVRA
jgi:YcxB-like protein